jgi:iron-sulfur cluster repair protein YtfE (RIC family)
MTSLTLEDRAGLPDSLRVLVEDYPRTGWQTHPHFGGMVAFWLQRHMLFRQLTARLTDDAQSAMDGGMERRDFDRHLARNAGLLLNELHGHHQIEDMHYFPRLIRLDTRLSSGFDLLERDHEAIDPLLHEMAEAANAVLSGGEIGRFGAALDRFGGLLDRHLVDEEDIVVPVILHTGWDG